MELETEVLSTYPVESERLEGFSQFLLPAGITPKRHLTIETTDILLLLSAGAAWGHCRVAG